ncbi:MAG: hypothetical protein RSA66_09165 [Muribaculaceae bacterium]
MYHNLTDIELIAQILAGNQRAVTYLFFEKCGSLFSYIAGNVFKHRVSRDELISEFFIYLKDNDWYRLRTFKGDNCKLTTWISIVAIRFFNQNHGLVIDSGSKSELPLYHSSEALELYNKAQERFIARIDVHNAICRMKNDRYKYVIIALEIEERKKEDVAWELGVTVDNLYNIRLRAIKQLSEIFKMKYNEN